MPCRVFLSYAQAPADHKKRVADLAASLKAAGLDVWYDGDVTSPQGPPEGWPKWMLDQIEQADWVLVLCNEAYYRRFRGQEIPGLGLGARWEGAVIGQALYTEGTVNRKFIPVLLGEDQPAHIPEPLRGATWYRIPAELSRLTSALTGSPAAASPESTSRPRPRPRTPKPKRTTGKPPKPPTPGHHPSFPYAMLALGGFLGALVLVALLLWKAELLARLGLTGSFYYLVLLPLGLAVAAFLFGALQSFARYRGKHFGGALELGGPVVGFALVVLGGFLLPPPATNFPLTVSVHGAAEPQDLILRGQGSVLLDLGTERRQRVIDDKGQALFPEIPASFRGQTVTVTLDAAGYELADPRPRKLDSPNLYLAVRKQPGRISGHVQDEAGKPVVGANIDIAGIPGTTDPAGHFEVIIPADRLRPDPLLQVIAQGYTPWRHPVIPNSNEVAVVLSRP